MVAQAASSKLRVPQVDKALLVKMIKLIKEKEKL
jgi:hypothetical protein